MDLERGGGTLPQEALDAARGLDAVLVLVLLQPPEVHSVVLLDVHGLPGVEHALGDDADEERHDHPGRDNDVDVVKMKTISGEVLDVTHLWA